MTTEFELIARHFARPPARASVVLGVGDDAALLRVPPGCELVATVDTLVAGVHFAADGDPRAVGHKALAVNLSDLAAMGAEPAWALLALTLPAAHESWLAAFMTGFDALARKAGVELVGGDTTRGPLALSVTALGQVPAGTALRRSGARPGDTVWVTGAIGGAGLAVGDGQSALTPPQRMAAQERLDYPVPRLAAGMALRGIASAAIDVSDGLAADLGHLLAASGVGAVVDLAAVPFAPGVPTGPGGWAAALAAGDDYELCFTVPPARAAALAAATHALDCPVTCIGVIEAAPGLRLPQPDGSLLELERAGYDHYAG